MSEGAATKIKKFIEAGTRKVEIPEMMAFVNACKQDDIRDGRPSGDTLAEMAASLS